MNRLDSHIEAVVHTLTFTPSRRDSSPCGSTLRIESDYLNESTKSSSSDARSISPDSNSSTKASKKHTKLSHKTSKVSPHPHLPVLNDAGESPLKSKSVRRNTSTTSLAAASGQTTVTTVDMEVEEIPSGNNQRKDKISNLDML